MQNYFFKYIFFLLILMVLFSCEVKRKSIDTSGNITPELVKMITVYGSESCEHCIEFRSKMDSAHIKYEFKDAEANEKYFSELILKMQTANIKEYVAFPVVEVDDQIYVRPEFEDFLKILGE